MQIGNLNKKMKTFLFTDAEDASKYLSIETIFIMNRNTVVKQVSSNFVDDTSFLFSTTNGNVPEYFDNINTFLKLYLVRIEE